MKTIIAILATLLIISTPALADQRDTLSAPMAPRITISARCQQLQITCTQSELLEIGRKLGQLYFNRYNQKPPQQGNVNVYTTTDSDLIDRAIISQLAAENEKLRKDLDLRDTEIGYLKQGKQK